MKAFAWIVFLTFVGISSTANYFHGEDTTAGLLLATVPVGFAVVVFLLEGLHAKGKASWQLTALLSLVGGGAGVTSYIGLYGMAREHGVQQVPALLLPLAFDGVVAVASLTIRAFGSVDTRPAELVVIEQPAVHVSSAVSSVQLGCPAVGQTVQDETPIEQALVQIEQPVFDPASKLEQAILLFGRDVDTWPALRTAGEQLGCAPSTVSKIKADVKALTSANS